MVLFPNNLYIFVWIQHFLGSPLNRLISEPSYIDWPYKESSIVHVESEKRVLCKNACGYRAWAVLHFSSLFLNRLNKAFYITVLEHTQEFYIIVLKQTL